MNRWIAAKNLETFRTKLADEKNPAKRRVLAKLIAREEQKLQEPDSEKS